RWDESEPLGSMVEARQLNPYSLEGTFASGGKVRFRLSDPEGQLRDLGLILRELRAAKRSPSLIDLVPRRNVPVQFFSPKKMGNKLGGEESSATFVLN
ncbi:MAG: hypothetical protein AAF191_10705, partial [Verrucomicrobiota bacterium]